MKIRILTSCTGEKKHSPQNQLTEEDLQFLHNSDAFAECEARVGEFRCAAAEIYTGQQHVRLMRGIEARPGIDCEVSVVSAGYGLIPGSRQIVPYEMTFQGMRKKPLQEWAQHLRIPGTARHWFAKPADLNLILLGESYLAALGLDDDVTFAAPTLFFCGKGGVKFIKGNGSHRVVTLSNPEAKRFSCGLVALKGELASQLVAKIAADAAVAGRTMEPNTDVLDLLDGAGEPIEPVAAPNTNGNRRNRFSVHIPRQGAKLLYFIPEWDDRVDPEYDFTTDTATHGRDPYSHDVYAHEIYGTPNYDGILVSKSVIEQNKTKRIRIGKIGIHAHLRVPRNFPIMGDCGAFNYIDQDVPPYETEETVRFYQELDFDFGVSIDHLIVPGVLKTKRFALRKTDGSREEITESRFKAMAASGVAIRKGSLAQRDPFLLEPVLENWEEECQGEEQRRWEITLANSRDFIKTHHRLGCSFTPVAGCQGWDIDSQVEMFRQQQKMGYDYIALGGLVRSQTSYILDLLEIVNRYRKEHTRIHIFGVARLEAIRDFVRAGVTSVDSASMLRQAWLSATSNYFSGDAKQQSRAIASGEQVPRPYTALRVPPSNREGTAIPTPKARKAVEEGVDIAVLRQAEQQALEHLRAFDHGEETVDRALTSVLAYSQLLGQGGDHEEHYRRLLTDMPWKTCPCRVCQEIGIDVVIFRRNNRNRRRGFHNTWWFYQTLVELEASVH